MQKSIFLFLMFCCFFGNAQNPSNNNTIIPEPNFYKATGDSIRINGLIKVVFKDNKFSTKEKRTASIFESVVNSNMPNKKSNIEILFIAQTLSTSEKRSLQN